MRRAALLVALAVVLAAVPALAVADDARGQPVLDATISENRLEPGEDTTLQVSLFNRGDLQERSETNPSLNQRVTTARGLTATLEEGDVPFDVQTSTRAVGSLPEGQSVPLTYQVSVDEDAEPGTYTVPLTVEYRYTSRINGDDETERQVERTIKATVVVDEDARMEVVNVSSDARVGSTDTVAVTVENTGTETAHDASLVLESSNAELTFGGASSATRHLGDWEADERRTVAYEVTVADSGKPQNYAVDATLQYEDADGVPRTSETRTIGVTPAPEYTFSVGDLSSNLAVGEEGTLSGTVTNDGDSLARNAVVVFSTQKDTVTAIETESPVGDLEPGGSAEFSFPIEISESAEAGPQQYTVSVEYRDRTGDRRTSDTIDLRQEVGPDVPEFSLAVDGASVSPGQGTEINVTVTNDADETFTDISANLFADDPVSAADDEAFVSRLEPGQSETVTFSVGAAGSALAKTYPLSMDFQYDDSDGDTIVSDTYRIPLSVEKTEEGGGPSLLVVGLVLLVVLGGAGFLYRRYY